MITLLEGPNSFATRERLSQIKTRFEAKNPGAETRQLNASDTTPDELEIYLTNNSMFSTKQLLVLKEVDENKEIAERLPNYLENLSGDIELILLASKPDKRTRWYKQAVKNGRVENFGELGEREMIDWAISRAKELGGELNAADARFLVSRIGLNQAQINSELNKLATYNRTITKDNIELLVDKTLEDSVFDLIDTVVKGRGKRAQEMYDRLLTKDIDAYQFIGLMSWQLHNLLVVKANYKTPTPQLAGQAGLAPFVINKTRRLVNALSLAQIKRLINLTIATDSDIKQTRADTDSRIKLLIDEITLVVAAG